MKNTMSTKIASGVLRRAIKVVELPPGRAYSHLMVHSDPKRGIPERVIGGWDVTPGDQQVHQSFLDPMFQGLGIAETGYKRLAALQPGGRLYSDRLLSPGSMGVWTSMVRKAQQAAQEGRGAAAIQGAPLSSSYTSTGSFMAGRGGPNFGIAMPPKSRLNPRPYEGGRALETPPPAADDAARAARGFPFTGGAVRDWARIPATLRQGLGQPALPAPNPRSTFSEFARDYLPFRGATAGPSAYKSPRNINSMMEAMKSKFEAQGSDLSTGIKELRTKLEANKARAVQAEAAKFGKPIPKREDFLEPVYGAGARQKPTGYVVKPGPGQQAAPAASPPQRTPEQQNIDYWLGRGQPATATPVSSVIRPASPSAPPPRAQSPSTQRVVDDWFSRGQTVEPPGFQLSRRRSAQREASRAALERYLMAESARRAQMPAWARVRDRLQDAWRGSDLRASINRLRSAVSRDGQNSRGPVDPNR